MNLNPFSWYRKYVKQSEMIRANTIKNNIEKRENDCETLLSHANRIRSNHILLGFKITSDYSCDPDYSYLTHTAVGPDNVVYTLKVTIGGGYRLVKV